MFTNSRWPPRSQIENVISVFRIEIVFSIKLTPGTVSRRIPLRFRGHTECLDVVLIPAALDVLDHQACLSDLGVAHHAYLDHHTALRLLVSMRLPLVLLLVRL